MYGFSTDPLEEMCINFGLLMDLHLLCDVSDVDHDGRRSAYHLEGIELLLDLLSKHRR